MRILLLSLLLASNSLAQVHPHLNDFIPPGWEIEYSLKSDLTGDGVPDVAMIVVEKSVGEQHGHRRLIVLKMYGTDYELVGHTTDDALQTAEENASGHVEKGDTSGIHLRSINGKLIL